MTIPLLRTYPGSMEARTPRVSLVRAISLSALAWGLLTANQLWVSPWIFEKVSAFAGQISFMAGRVLGLVVLAFALTVWARAERFRALSLTTLVAFLDGFILNAVRLAVELQKNPALLSPAAPGGEPASIGGALLALALSFILFFPVLLLFAFAGTELGKVWLGRRADKTLKESPAAAS